MRSGLDGDAFWTRTPRLIALELNARAEALDHEHEMRAWLAWHVGALSNTDGKHYPKSPADLLPKTVEAAPSAADWREMDRAALAWAVNAGGRVEQG